MTMNQADGSGSTAGRIKSLGNGRGFVLDSFSLCRLFTSWARDRMSEAVSCMVE